MITESDQTYALMSGDLYINLVHVEFMAYLLV